MLPVLRTASPSRAKNASLRSKGVPPAQTFLLHSSASPSHRPPLKFPQSTLQSTKFINSL